ncbi:conserved hypothetical protein [Anaeromyxobacter dehalogenans 2CP-1]|uniref:Uncharacterized protein n=1 Tax=Anaeromyxobacter dehalogenans (strain ATCC BAA-258 / DSM 21875 / 2CP-1) TaxID=455488 RepID=B8JFE5_ANAD2|nr:hypothetical protein [Anaeromyxobacter dehalogenans]ACL66322.1 conserved hypothetical protein [Anaeromyxobacter dehalogenans 2CP-1]
MLARLDAIPGVRESRADASGRHFLLELRPGADRAAAVEAACAALGARARPLEPAEAAAQLEARGRGDPWYAGADTLALCYLEARVLAANAGPAAARAAGLDTAAGDAICEAARAVLFQVMERVHGEGGRSSSGWFYEEWPAIAEAISGRATRLLPALTDDDATRLRRAVAALHAR